MKEIFNIFGILTGVIIGSISVKVILNKISSRNSIKSNNTNAKTDITTYNDGISSYNIIDLNEKSNAKDMYSNISLSLQKEPSQKEINKKI